MREDLERLYKRLRGKRTVFVGLGVSNSELAGMLAEEGVSVTACDRRSREELGAVCEALEEKGARLLIGKDYPDAFEGDVLLRTPGMYYRAPALKAFCDGGGVVTSEMELFCELCPCPLFAVTGSDGKTTTTTLISELLSARGQGSGRVHLGGNIGRALLPVLGEISPEDYAAVELSSFQLMSMRCAPDVSVVTNVTPNHLDVHRDMAEYIEAKRNILAHQNAFSATVLGLDDETAAAFAPEVRGRLLGFSLKRPVSSGAYLGADGILYRARGGVATPLLNREEIRLPGMHNVANLLAAVAAVGDLATPETIARVAREFNGVEHRIELARELDGVKWYNDSIATSPTRAIAGLSSFRAKIILIAGGYDKNLSFDPLAPALVEKVKLLILTGPTADKIEASLRRCPCYNGEPSVIRAGDLAGAVAAARSAARAGDVVSLSPASASFDCYPNFEARGRHFKELVNAL
ncbi:MAG: UDP-N-acetylmuramoyl-L-alanine--D-glutamate ligase [Oscillospiraceae bacterium]|jgi:UDP-N-acetylmuramoylalanine--D-glutamate ligase|nr:UDP-N-acetylmuramoyl-L-alanine--D-glutamate ligase [Oscillospiraceae bacterium]